MRNISNNCNNSKNCRSKLFPLLLRVKVWQGRSEIVYCNFEFPFLTNKFKIWALRLTFKKANIAKVERLLNLVPEPLPSELEQTFPVSYEESLNTVLQVKI